MPKGLKIVHRDASYYITRSDESAAKQSEGGRFRVTDISKLPNASVTKAMRDQGKHVIIDETCDVNYNGYEGPSAADIADLWSYEGC